MNTKNLVALSFLFFLASCSTLPATFRGPSATTSQRQSDDAPYFAKAPSAMCTAYEIRDKARNCGDLANQLVYDQSVAASSETIIQDVCKTISLALANGSELSPQDYFHCHSLIKENPYPEDKRWTWETLLPLYRGLLCHAHEEQPRGFKNGIDDTNIVIFPGKDAFYLGRGAPAGAYDLARLGTPPQRLGEQIEFFQEGSKYCALTINSPVVVQCPGIPRRICVGVWKPNPFY